MFSILNVTVVFKVLINFFLKLANYF